MPSVWVVLRGVDAGTPEVDVFSNPNAAREHWERLTADGVQPDVYPPREENVQPRAWAPEGDDDA
jgi:hypothetical protein